MEFTRRLNALLMNLWGRKRSPRPTPPPSWLLPLIIFFVAKDGDALYSQQKQDRKLTVAQIMNSLLQNSDLY